MTSRDLTITTLRKRECYDRDSCVGVHTLADRPGRTYFVLKAVTDPDELAAFASEVGEGEIIGHDDCELFPEGM